MAYLVTMTAQVPDGTPDQAAGRARARPARMDPRMTAGITPLRQHPGGPALIVT
jgi:muconolactone delta-isomerase